MLKVLLPFLNSCASRFTVARIGCASLDAAQDAIGYFETSTASGFHDIDARPMPAKALAIVLDSDRYFALGILTDRRAVQFEVAERQVHARRLRQRLDGCRDRSVATRRLSHFLAVFTDQGDGRCSRLIRVGLDFQGLNVHGPDVAPPAFMTIDSRSPS